MGQKQQEAQRTGRTVFLGTVHEPPSEPRSGVNKIRIPLHVLSFAGANKKIGGWMLKGRWRGMPIFSLTLEERKTCPRACPQWGSCYGDNMHLAKRWEAGPELEMALEADLACLDSTFPDGYLVRLHVLGDFYSVGYVKFWDRMIRQHACRIYGYTHRQPSEAIGRALTTLAQTYPDRVALMRSDPTDPLDPLPKAFVVDRKATEGALGTVICPNESGKTASCGNCGLCMNGRTSVSFLDHSHKAVNAAQWEARRQLKVLNV